MFPAPHHNSQDMENTYTLYFYSYQGQKYCSPSIDVAFNRNDDGEVTQITYESGR